jgi:hypothetical protein
MKKNGVVFNKKVLKSARNLAKWARGMNWGTSSVFEGVFSLEDLQREVRRANSNHLFALSIYQRLMAWGGPLTQTSVTYAYLGIPLWDLED